MSGKIDLDRFIDDVAKASRESGGQRAVDEVLARIVSDPGSWIAAVGEPSAPGLQKLHHGRDLTILNVTWAPLMILYPHNHNMWASIAIYTGREDNILWERKGPKVEATRAASIAEKEVFPLPRDAVHSVSNPIPRLTGAIHVYGGDFFAPEGRLEWDPETLREKPFDLAAAQARFREANERFQSGR